MFFELVELISEMPQLDPSNLNFEVYSVKERSSYIALKVTTKFTIDYLKEIIERTAEELGQKCYIINTVDSSKCVVVKCYSPKMGKTFKIKALKLIKEDHKSAKGILSFYNPERVAMTCTPSVVEGQLDEPNVNDSRFVSFTITEEFDRRYLMQSIIKEARENTSVFCTIYQSKDDDKYVVVDCYTPSDTFLFMKEAKVVIEKHNVYMIDQDKKSVVTYYDIPLL